MERSLAWTPRRVRYATCMDQANSCTARLAALCGECGKLHETPHALRWDVRDRELPIGGGDSHLRLVTKAEGAERDAEGEQGGSVNLPNTGFACNSDCRLESFS